jgi:hypothetical protein
MAKNVSVGSGYRSVINFPPGIQYYESKDPDPNEIFTDPQHYLLYIEVKL